MPTLDAAATATARCAATGAARERRWKATAAVGETAPSRPGAAAWSPSVAATASTGSAGLSGHSASAGAPRLPASAGAARLLVDEDERPLVVVVPPLIKANRFFLALAHHAHHAAGDGAAEPGTRCRRPGAKSSRGRASAAALPRTCAERLRSGRTAARPTHGLPTLAGDAAAGRNRDEVFTGDRVFEFLADVTALDQDVDAGRQRLGLRVVEPNRADVLLPAEDELGFLLALRLVTPHGHRDRHQHRHHGKRHEQRRHRVACLAGSQTRSFLTP